MRPTTHSFEETAAQRSARFDREARDQRFAKMLRANPTSIPDSIPEKADDENGTVAAASVLSSSTTDLSQRSSSTFSEAPEDYSELDSNNLSNPEHFSTEAYIKFSNEQARAPASAATEAEALQRRRAKLAEQKTAASVEAVSTIPQRSEAYLFADEIILLNYWVRLINFKVKPDKRCWPINPLSALGLYNFSPDGSAAEFQHLIDSADNISAEHKDCMPLELSPAMRDELRRNSPASYDPDIFQVTRHPEKVEKFYDVIYRHWGEAYHELRRETTQLKQLELAYNDLLIFLEEHKKRL